MEDKTYREKSYQTDVYITHIEVTVKATWREGDSTDRMEGWDGDPTDDTVETSTWGKSVPPETGSLNQTCSE